jgi:hypothetical protein
MVENEWYIKGAGMSMQDNMDLGTLRALACPKTMQLVAKPWIRTPTAKDDARYEGVVRSITGALMAHDIQNGPMADSLRRNLDYFVDFNSGSKCRFVGYWDVDENRVKQLDPRIKCSLYFSPARKNAVLWLLNSAAEPVDAKDMVFTSDVFGRETLAAALDAEDQAAIRVRDAGSHKTVTFHTFDEPLVLQPHDFRAVVLKVE